MTVSPRYSPRGVPRGASPGSTSMPSCSSDSPSSRSEHTMPRDSTPRIFAGFSSMRPPVWPSISSAPTRAKAIFCPAATFGAPQTTVSLPSPVSTVASRRRSALG